MSTKQSEKAGAPAENTVQPVGDAAASDASLTPSPGVEQTLADAQARADQLAADAPSEVPQGPIVVNPTLADAPLEVHTAAAISAGRMATSGNTGAVGEQIQNRVSDIDQAVALREDQATAINAQTAARQAQAEVERIQNAAPPDPSAQIAMNQTLRAPVTNAMQHRTEELAGAGIHPDVTSPTSAPVGDVKIPGTGVAEITDLAPGQDLSPSPPVSSSNIVPTPNKPGSVFAKL